MSTPLTDTDLDRFVKQAIDTTKQTTGSSLLTEHVIEYSNFLLRERFLGIDGVIGHLIADARTVRTIRSRMVAWFKTTPNPKTGRIYMELAIMLPSDDEDEVGMLVTDSVVQEEPKNKDEFITFLKALEGTLRLYADLLQSEKELAESDAILSARETSVHETPRGPLSVPNIAAAEMGPPPTQSAAVEPSAPTEPTATPVKAPNASPEYTGEAECPECAHTWTLTKVTKGEIIQCPGCTVELEITGLDPITLALAPKEEQDWGQ